MRRALALLFIGTCSQCCLAQDYFQQEVHYNIQVTLDDEAHSLSAFEEIRYVNNSPDELKFIYFHLWPNAYKNNKTALGKQILESNGKGRYLDNPEQSGSIDSLDFKVDGQSVRWEFDQEHIDICKLFLNEPLGPGNRITISTPFHVKLPTSNLSRLGHSGQAYMITQWYPKPAVYDHKGWHPMPYLDIGEFYSEYGSFEVSIEVPDNYNVAATGVLQNVGEQERIDSIASATATVEHFDTDNKAFPESSDSWKTLVYKENNVHDFAWFADKRFNILRGEVELPNSSRKVNTWAYFPNHEAHLWKDAIEYLNDALYYYSLWYGDYPFENCTAISAPFGNGGMEYPTITLISSSSTAMALEVVIMHEVGHNWFYSILGSNERLHPWMDEGLNTFSEIRYMHTKYPDNEVYKMQIKSEKVARIMGMDKMPYASMHQAIYQLMARRNADVPTSSRSEFLRGMNYSAIAYSKTGLSFFHLMEYMGEEDFNKAMQEYYETWKFRHPYPEDLHAIFEKHINKDLSWFFDGLMGSDDKLDYGISRVRKNKILLKNHGDIKAPVLLTATTKAGKQTENWIEGFEGKQWVELKNPEQAKSIHLYGYTYPELHPDNNYAKVGGLLAKADTLKVRSFGILQKPGHSAINILPAAAWNTHNGFMVGGLLYNNIFPLGRFEYQLMPMFSLGTTDLAGMGKIQWHSSPSIRGVQRLTVSVNARQFAFTDVSGKYYQKAAAEVKALVGKKTVNPIRNEVSVQFIYASSLPGIYSGERNMNSYAQAKFERISNSKYSPYQVAANVHGNDAFVKAQVDASYKHTYIYNNSLDIRFFAGAFLHRDESASGVYNFTASGVSGMNDYLFENLYLARFEFPTGKDLAGKQFSEQMGGLAAVAPGASSTSYIAALNVSSSLPIKKKIPVQGYANVAFTGENAFWAAKDDLTYEAGVKLQVIRDTFEFFLPIMVSEDIQNYYDVANTDFLERIRFTINFSAFDIFEKAKNF